MPTSPTHSLEGPALDNRRIAAALIDLAAPVVAAVALIAAGLLTPATGLVLVGWTLFYFFALESGGGQTLGKRAMRLRVVSDQGGDPSMQQYATRTLTRVVDTPGIGLVAMLVTGDKRQRLGDMAARTSVVDGQSLGVPTAQMDAFDAAHAHSTALTQPSEPAEAKPKRSRPGLGGPELKMPSFGRSKAPKAPKAAKAAKAPKAPKQGRPTLGGPELKMPSFGRSKTPKAAKAPKPAKEGRPTLGGPEIKMPSFGRRKQKPVAPPEPEEFAPAPAPAPDPMPVEPIVADPEPEIQIDPFSEAAPEPVVEVVSHGEPEPEPEADVPAEPEIMSQDVPDVEIVREIPEEPPAPDVAPPRVPVPAAASRPLIPAIPAIEIEPEPESGREPDPEPEHVEGIRDDGSSRVHVKPIETVSAMELLMREAEEQDRNGR